MVNHYYPLTLDEALFQINQSEYQIIAGGTDVMIQYRSWADTSLQTKKPLLFIHQLKELDFIVRDKNYINVGACVTLSNLFKSPLIPLVLKNTIIEIASPSIRNTATLAGNIANASPAADAVCTLIALDALVEIKSLDSVRTVKIEHLITGVKKTSLLSNEIITTIKIPNIHHDYQFFYKVGGRKADAISKVSLAAVANILDGRITKWRLAFGAVGPKVVTDITKDETFVGKTIDEIRESILSVQELYASIIHPIDDQRSTKQYRSTVAGNLIKKFIEALI